MRTAASWTCRFKSVKALALEDRRSSRRAAPSFETRREYRRAAASHARGQDRCLDHGVLGTVKSEEVAVAALSDGLGHEGRPVFAVVELDDAELVISAGVDQDLARDHLGRPRGRPSTSAPMAVWARAARRR